MRRKDLVIILPTCRQDIYERCMKTLRQSPWHIHVYAQGFHPARPHMYSEELLGTFRANNEAAKYAPYADLYMFIDDDFIFRDGWIDDVRTAIKHFEEHQNIGVISLLDSKSPSSHKGKLKLDLDKGELFYNVPTSVLKLRKESGIIIRHELIKYDLKVTAYGEDFSKIVHCYLEGYDVCNMKAEISHDHVHGHKYAWMNLSKQMFSENPKQFYYEVLREEGLLDDNGFTEKGLDVVLRKRKELSESTIFSRTLKKIDNMFTCIGEED